MVSKRPKKQFERSNILELGYRAVSGGEGRWVCPEHYGRAVVTVNFRLINISVSSWLCNHLTCILHACYPMLSLYLVFFL